MTETLAVEDFPAWESQVSAAGACSHPIRLTGKVQAVNLVTGETAEVFKTWTDVPYIDGKGELDTWRDDQSVACRLRQPPRSGVPGVLGGLQAGCPPAGARGPGRWQGRP